MINWIVTSSVLILIIIFLRAVLRGKISLRLQYALWAIVLIRLLFPFEFGATDLSLLNAVENVPVVQEIESMQGVDSIEHMHSGAVEGYYGLIGDDVTVVAENKTPKEFSRMKTALSLRNVLMPIWKIGTAVILLVFVFSNCRFAGELKASRTRKETALSKLPVYITDKVDTPCLFGLFKPAIYVTEEAAEQENVFRHAVEHETTHFYHKDHIWAVLRCLAIAIHWYNPIVWWAAKLSREDAELACDETTLIRLGDSERASYGRTLLSVTCEKRAALFSTATTMTGSGKSIKERIALIAKKPKMAVYTLVTVLVITLVVALCTFTGAENHKFEEWLRNVTAEDVGVAYVTWDVGVSPKSKQLSEDNEKDLCRLLNQIERSALSKESNSGSHDSYILIVPWFDESNIRHECMFKVQDEASVSVTFDYETSIEMIEEGTYWYIHSPELVAFIKATSEKNDEELMPTVELTRADVDSDGELEIISVNERLQDVFQLTVTEEDGTVVWEEDAGLAHVGWNTLMLYEHNGTEALVRYNPYASTGIASYSITMFRLQNGEEKVLYEDSVQFRMADPKEYPSEVSEFMGNAIELMQYCTVLLSTQDGQLVIGPSSTQNLQQQNQDILAEMQNSDNETVDVTEAMRKTAPTHFTYFESLGYVYADELADALNHAAEHQISSKEAEAKGYDPEAHAFWEAKAYTQGYIETGITRGHMRFELACGLSKNVVEVTYGKHGSYSTGYFEDETLYNLIRYENRTRMELIDEEAFEAHEEVLVAQMEHTLTVMSESQPSIYDYELVKFYPVYEYTEDDGSRVVLYDFDYGLLTDEPQNILLAGGMYFDGYMRLRGLNIGQFAVRLWDDVPQIYVFMANDERYDPEYAVVEDETFWREKISERLNMKEKELSL